MGTDGTTCVGCGRCPAPVTPWELQWESPGLRGVSLTCIGKVTFCNDLVHPLFCWSGGGNQGQREK